MDFPSGKLTYEFPNMNPKERLRELIIYIAEASQFDQNFGKTKLVKLLYMSDFGSFRDYGKPITGYRYVKLPNGPFPDKLDPLLAEMQRDGDITIQEVSYLGYPNPQQRVIPLRQAELESFTAQDIANVARLIRDHLNYTGTNMADLTHGIAWKVADMAEPIPYEASIISDEDLTQDDIKHINELIEQYGIDPD